jgi:hypothetical protein
MEIAIVKFFTGRKVARCCNPFMSHSKPVTKNLRAVTEQDQDRMIILKVGAYWCDNCRKRASDKWKTCSAL